MSVPVFMLVFFLCCGGIEPPVLIWLFGKESGNGQEKDNQRKLALAACRCGALVIQCERYGFTLDACPGVVAYPHGLTVGE